MRIATFTVTRDEAVFLPKWVENAMKSFDPSDIYILDHQSTDGSVDLAREAGCKVETIYPPDSPDASWFREKIKQVQRELLEKYDWVLFSETDEFVIPNPSLGSMENVVDQLRKEDIPFFRCTGFDIVQDRINESAMDFKKEMWLDQRTRCIPWFQPYSTKMLYSKPLLSRVPLSWRNGFHDVDGVNGRLTLDIPRYDYLYLVHCHYLDFNETERRHNLRLRSKKDYSHGAQLELGNELVKKFDHMLSLSHEIPDYIKGLI